jgi:hypothetical protein
MQQEACDKVYRSRIMRGRESYSSNKFGAFGSDLGAVACFFEQFWSRVSPALTEPAQAWLLNQAGLCLRALGRLTEALEVMLASRERSLKLKDWENASIDASNLSMLELILGNVAAAVADAEQAVTHAVTPHEGPRGTFRMRIVGIDAARVPESSAYDWYWVAGNARLAGIRQAAPGGGWKLFHNAGASQSATRPSPALFSLRFVLRHAPLLRRAPHGDACSIFLRP